MLVFRTGRLSREEWTRLAEIADYMGIDKRTGLRLFRLNPVKAAHKGLRETLRILGTHRVVVSSELVELVETLEREGIDVYIDWFGEDLAVYTWSKEYSRELRESGAARWDAPRGILRIRPMHLHHAMSVAARKGLRVYAGFRIDYRLSLDPGAPRTRLRPYQREALGKWVEAGYRGVIGLPTGSGKTLIAVHALARLRVTTLILVPTIDLLHQWRRVLQEQLDLPRGAVGIYGGGRREVAPITIMTYDSATSAAIRVSTRFGLVVADECHHAVSPSYRRALERLTSPYRMGLTATPWRSDGLHAYYPEVIGEVVYWSRPRELQEKGFLARHREEKIYVELSEEEKERYRKLLTRYKEYCSKKVPWAKDPLKQFEEVLRLAARDEEAREALRARNEARKIALNAPAKIRVILDLLAKHRDDKVIIFSRYTDIVREISRALLVPLILHDTDKEERRRYLSYFREGRIRVLATAMALDEGVDVPDASVAIVISGTGSSREYIQRLGRILRPKDKEAVLYEILTRGTLDVSLSRRRRRIDDLRQT